MASSLAADAILAHVAGRHGWPEDPRRLRGALIEPLAAPAIIVENGGVSRATRLHLPSFGRVFNGSWDEDSRGVPRCRG
jgi:hypothetical protein